MGRNKHDEKRRAASEIEVNMSINTSGCDSMVLAVYDSPKIENAVLEGEKRGNVNSAFQNASGGSETVRNRCLFVEERRRGDIECVNVKNDRKTD
jgi:hypothetical protein